jgi:HAD superfamily hydrolase (TIGR01509 family)
MIQALFWDNDGVLVDTEKLYFQATREALQTVGVLLTEPLFKRISLTEGRSVFDLAAEQGIPAGTIGRMQEWRNRRYLELLGGEVRVMDGVRETLGALKGTFRLGIVTSSRKIHFEAMHVRTGLLPYFDFILTREDFVLSKPDPEPYRRAMERCGCGPAECLVIEDSPRGVASAVAAGIRCLVVPNDLTRGAAFAGAWRILADCREVPGEIRRLAGPATGLRP